MPNRKHQSITLRIGAALASIGKGLSRLKPGAGAASAIAIPILPSFAVANPIALDLGYHSTFPLGMFQPQLPRLVDVHP